MKVPRFIREYASYTMKELNNSLANDMCKRECLTTPQAMKEQANPIDWKPKKSREA